MPVHHNETPPDGSIGSPVVGENAGKCSPAGLPAEEASVDEDDDEDDPPPWMAVNLL